MDETTTYGAPGAQATDAVPQDPYPPKRKPGNPNFQPGHPRFGGRKKGSQNKRTIFLRDTAAQMDADPARFLMEIMTRDAVQVVLVNPITGAVMIGEDGEPIRQWQAVPLEMRQDAAKTLMSYIHPKPQPAAPAPTENPVDVTSVQINELMSDPKMVEAAQVLALGVSNAPAIPVPEPPETDEGPDRE